MIKRVVSGRDYKSWVVQSGLMALVVSGIATTAFAQGAVESNRSPAGEASYDVAGTTENKGAAKGSDTGSAPQEFVFGRDYMRVSIEYIFLPRVSKQINGVTVRVTTKNKRPLNFDFAVPSEAGQTYSNMGQWLVVPYVALNNKGPLEITQEIRTQRDRTSSFSWIPNMLSSVAGVLTGGWSTTASSLAQYATSASSIVNIYDKHTEVQDVNHFMLFDNAQGHGIDRFTSFRNAEKGNAGSQDGKGAMQSPLWFSHFSKGSGFFHVRKNDRKGKVERVKEPENVLVEREWDNDSPTFYKIKKRGTEDWYYPEGKEAYIILKFEKYNPFPSLKTNPRSVPGVGVHFDNIDKILISNPSTATDKTATELRKKSLDTEGSDLMKTLQGLTDSGDLSLTDASEVMTAFIKRVKRDAKGVNLDYLKRINDFPVSLP